MERERAEQNGDVGAFDGSSNLDEAAYAVYNKMILKKGAQCMESKEKKQERPSIEELMDRNLRLRKEGKLHLHLPDLTYFPKKRDKSSKS